MGVDLDGSLQNLTKGIIGAAFTVANTLGHGFLENVYKNALCEELRFQDFSVHLEKTFPVHYRDKQIGTYVADIVVDDRVIVELKAIECLVAAHRAQVLNYLRASGLPVGLLMNFGTPRLEVRRVIL
jgi:GxxExxY protein